MKRRIAVLAICGAMVIGCFSGCGSADGNNQAMTPDDMEPNYYTSESDLPNDAYYIVKTITDKDGEETTRYYPLLSTENTCEEVQDGYEGFDATRIEWVNYTVDEGLIPTMSVEDKLIYKSETYIPTEYSLEKFFDNGYTFGVAGMYADTSKNVKYEEETGSILSTSSAAGFTSLAEAESIYLVSVKSTTEKDAETVRIRDDNISDSGTVEDLTLMDVYDCDIRTGTTKVAAQLTADTHYYSSAETYRFGEFDFITEYIAELEVPTYATTGYYTIGSDAGAGGFFRYVEDDSDYKELSADDYNTTIYLYNENGQVAGTTVGLAFDPETGFLVGEDTLEDYDASAADTQLYTYKQWKGLESGEYSDDDEDDPEDSVTNKTTLDKLSGDTYMGTFKVTSVTRDTISTNHRLIEFTATEINNADTLNFRYYAATGNDSLIPTEGGTYTIQFNAASGYDGYIASYMENVSSATDAESGATQKNADGENSADGADSAE